MIFLRKRRIDSRGSAKIKRAQQLKGGAGGFRMAYYYFASMAPHCTGRWNIAFLSWTAILITVHPFHLLTLHKSVDSNCLGLRKSQKKQHYWPRIIIIRVNAENEYSEYSSVSTKHNLLLSGIPLFLPNDFVKDDALVWPIPLGHVPESLRTCSIYRSDVTRLTPIQKCTLTHNQARLCGFLYNETLGCIAAVTTDHTSDDVLYYRGESLFRIVNYEAKVPFPVATVELILEPSLDMDEMEYTSLEKELVKLKNFLLDYSQLQIETAQEPKSPLEISLLENLTARPSQAELRVAQERRTVIEAAHLKYLVDLAPDIVGGGGANDNEQRCALMLLTETKSKVQHACEMVQERLSLERARKIASGITDAVDASTKELKVGPPKLPPWANQIRRGARLEYFWNVEIGWCPGTVTDHPIWIVNEWIISVQFDDDGSIHRLPLSADEKLRWRPL